MEMSDIFFWFQRVKNRYFSFLNISMYNMCTYTVPGTKYNQVPLYRGPIKRDITHDTAVIEAEPWLNSNYHMTVWILARNDINFSMAAGLIRLHMPGVK